MALSTNSNFEFIDLPINIQLSKTSKFRIELQVRPENNANCIIRFAAMEMIGFEPTASAVQVRRSPN